ncbi:MAG: DUF2877 domain-containing protein [Spirochaetota bacterium]
MRTETATRVLPRAVSLGPAIPRNAWTFSVHSIFRTAVNVSFDDGDLLACITGPSGSGQPVSVVLALETDFRELPLSVGMPGRFAQGLLSFGKGRLIVGLDCSSARWSPASVMSSICSIGNAFEAAALELGRIQASRGAEILFHRSTCSPAPCTPAAAAIYEGLRLLDAASALGTATRMDPIAFATALSLLVGTGPGLTPSGDDLLCGYMAALSAVSCPAVPVLAAAIEAASWATSDISASWLRCAARGLFHGALAGLSRNLAADELFPAVGALRELCSIGHFSGADMATGFLHGLAVHSGGRAGYGSEQGRLYAS